PRSLDQARVITGREPRQAERIVRRTHDGLTPLLQCRRENQREGRKRRQQDEEEQRVTKASERWNRHQLSDDEKPCRDALITASRHSEQRSGLSGGAAAGTKRRVSRVQCIVPEGDPSNPFVCR